MEKGEIRRLVLRALYDLGTGSHMNAHLLKKIKELQPGLSDEELLGSLSSCRLYNSPILEAIEYLNDKNLIEYHEEKPSNAPGPVFFQARINAYGKDIIDDPNRLDKEIPIVHQTINISGGQAAISGTGDSTFNLNQYLPKDDETKKDIEELKELLKSKPRLLDWIKGLATTIPGIIALLKLLGLS